MPSRGALALTLAFATFGAAPAAQAACAPGAPPSYDDVQAIAIARYACGGIHRGQDWVGCFPQREVTFERDSRAQFSRESNVHLKPLRGGPANYWFARTLAMLEAARFLTTPDFLTDPDNSSLQIMVRRCGTEREVMLGGARWGGARRMRALYAQLTALLDELETVV